MVRRAPKRPLCPLCSTPLVSAMVPRISRRGEKIQCACGATCWVRRTLDGRELFVAMFRPNRVIRVRVIRGAER